MIQLRWQPVLEFPARLRMVRKDYGRRIGNSKITQQAFAVVIDANPNTYKQWEAGHSKPQDLEGFAKRVAKATGCDPAWLLGVAGDAAPDTPPGQGISQRACDGDILRFRARRTVAPAVVHFPHRISA